MATTRKVLLGGPGTQLPFFIESSLSWLLCLSCLGVSCYHYVKNTFIHPWLSRWRKSSSKIATHVEDDDLPFLQCFIPLTAYSRSELSRFTPLQRYHQLVHLFEAISVGKNMEQVSDAHFIEIFRTHHTLRRLATLTLIPYPLSKSTLATSNLLLDYPHLPGLHKLATLWPQLLTLPPIVTETASPMYPFEISCIVPAYCESGAFLCKRLERALHVCRNPTSVEIIIVDAGGGTDDFEARVRHLQQLHNHKDHSRLENQWGHVTILPFSKGGGRGPCLNFGAAAARGRIVTFCHSDTALPSAWDVKIRQALLDSHSNIQSNSCAFSFGIDTSIDGLNGSYFPPGIKAVETTANIRTMLFSLPYGDQVLSITKVVFDYLGGFPDQCLMEDYEFVALLRKRASLLPKLGILQREKLCIIGGEPALCSPRRWQRFGVLYVTFMNSLLVNKYAGGMDPDELYYKYYGQDVPKRESPLSPWEIDLKIVLGLQ
jgi:glycosyltransferase involved in cell wall biosynthesis